MLQVLQKGIDYPKKYECLNHRNQPVAKNGDFLAKWCKRCGHEYPATAKTVNVIGMRVTTFEDGIVIRNDRGFNLSVK